MDRTESLARDHLVFRGYQNPEYEPDGNVPPDFSIDRRIAVEVRRLNENEKDTKVPKGLEETEIPFLMGMQKLTKSFGPANPDAWWLRLRYGRPMPAWRDLAAAAKAFLTRVRDANSRERAAERIHANVEIEAIPRADNGDDMFSVAITSDEDSGGWVFELLEQNLRLCIEQKTEKVRPYRRKYPEWWLLLVDQVAYGLSESERAEFKARVNVPHTWDKVIVVNALDHTQYFEL